MNAPSTIARFEGPVSWVPGPGAAGITLLGRSADSPATAAQLSLIGTQAVALPATLVDVTVESSGAAAVLLHAGTREWRIACRTWQLHRDVGVAFYAAIPPRPTPWIRRFTWRVLLGVAATAPGRWLLAKKSNRV